MNHKQNKPKDHHYVPVCYLKNFAAEDSRLSTLNLANLGKGYFTKVKNLYPAQVCYIENYYQITEEIKAHYEEFSHYDESFVESDILKRVENDYPKVFQQITEARRLSNAEACQMVDFIIQTKLRNPYYREKVIDKNLANWTSEFIDEFAEEFRRDPHYAKVPQHVKEDHIQRLRIEHQPGPAATEQFQLRSLILRTLTDNENNRRIRHTLLSQQWDLLRATGKERFITTANPGFSLDEKGSYNTKFDGDYQFYFPLSPKYCLLFGGQLDSRFLNGAAEKVIEDFPIPDEMVNALNENQLDHAGHYAIGCNADFLSKIRKIR